MIALRCILHTAVGLLLAATLLSLGSPAGAQAPRPEFRALWVDAFNPGIYSASEIDRLVAYVKAANLNAIVVQIGRRGDCFCNNASMPRTQAAISPYPFDPLETLIRVAHAQGIEVHAWIITTAMWNSSTPPRDPNHAFNQHGQGSTGYDNWLSVRYDGALREGDGPSANWFFDPGHPDAADYIVRMYTSVAQNYDVDGLNFDRVRYPDIQLSAWPNDNAWGYNAVALARFHAATGRADYPLPDDAQWQEWRREQVTNIVRRVYLETFAFKPQLRISADTITYGAGPDDPQWGSWEQSRPYRETLQDWRGWMQEGILDLNIPMNYKREHCPGEPGCVGNQRLWYEQWNTFAKDNQFARETTIGSALYLNSIANSVVQVRKALQPSALGNEGIGWVGYSYATPDRLTTPMNRDERRAQLTLALTRPSSYDPILPPIFETPAPVPSMPWKTSPEAGHLMGTVRSRIDGGAFDQLGVEVLDARTNALVDWRVTDGSGWFGLVDLPPGAYRVVLDEARTVQREELLAHVGAGRVTRLAFTPIPSGLERRRSFVPSPAPSVTGLTEVDLRHEHTGQR